MAHSACRAADAELHVLWTGERVQDEAAVAVQVAAPPGHRVTGRRHDDQILITKVGLRFRPAGPARGGRAVLPGRPGAVPPASRLRRRSPDPGQPRLHRPQHRRARHRTRLLPAGSRALPRSRRHRERSQHTRPVGPRQRRPRAHSRNPRGVAARTEALPGPASHHGRETPAGPTRPAETTGTELNAPISLRIGSRGCPRVGCRRAGRVRGRAGRPGRRRWTRLAAAVPRRSVSVGVPRWGT